MFETYASLMPLAQLHTGTTNLVEISDLYKLQEDPILLAHVFCKNFGIIVLESKKYFGVSEEDKASWAVEELHKALLAYDAARGASVQVFFSRCLNNRLRSETQSLNRHRRKANTNCQEFEAMSEISAAYTESAYAHVELVETLAQLNLSDRELDYCKIVMDYYPHVKDTDIAKSFGVSSAAIHYLKEGIEQKLRSTSLFRKNVQAT